MLDLESLFKLSYGMCIVSSKMDGKFNGCIVNTVFQVTPEPPTIAVSVNRQNLTHQYITKSRIMTVSILSQRAPMPLIGRFGFRSGRDINKFEHVNFKTGQNLLPIITDSTVAYIEAELLSSIDVETHTLFIAKITACQNLDVENEPMTYTYYRDIKQGRTPRTAATYVEKKPAQELKKERAKKMKKYKCLICGYIYDPDVGDPAGSIPPGTVFELLPQDWVCPDCGASKDNFELVED